MSQLFPPVAGSPPAPDNPVVRPGPTIIKFGGTSLATAHRIRRAADRVARLHRDGRQPVVVVSAQGHATDRILARLEAVAGGAGGRRGFGRERDRALATGEDLAAALLALALRALGVPARSLRGGEAGLRAAGPFGAGRPVTLHSTRLARILVARQVPVVAGFQAVRADGETVTLGRGGSDITAVFLAVHLRARECHIVTDVAGVHTADPRREPDAVLLPFLAHADLVRLAAAGAEVVHPDAARRAALAGLPLRVLHHRAPFHSPGGTLVTAAAEATPCR